MFNTLYTETTYYYKNYNNYTDWLILGTLFTLSVNQWALTLIQKNTILTFSVWPLAFLCGCKVKKNNQKKTNIHTNKQTVLTKLKKQKQPITFTEINWHTEEQKVFCLLNRIWKLMYRCKIHVSTSTIKDPYCTIQARTPYIILRWNFSLIRELTYLENSLSLFILTHSY